MISPYMLLRARENAKAVQLCAFDEAVSSENKNVWTIWAQIEGMARFLSQDNWRWYRKCTYIPG